MKIVVTSDLHIHPYRLCSRDGGKDRLHDGLSALRQTFEAARGLSCPWVFCGDMKIPKLSWPQEALTGALALFTQFNDVPKLMLPGNHDGDASHVGGSGLAPFATHARVIDHPTVIEWEGLTVAVAPWQAQRDTKALFEEARRRKVTTLLTHGFVAGTLLGPNETRLPGLGLQLADLGAGDIFSLVMLGDVHKGQRLARSGRTPPVWVPWCDDKTSYVRPAERWNGDVMYPGSPYQQNWGERNDGVKGCLLVDLDDGLVTLWPVDAPRYLSIELPNLQFDALEGLMRDAPTWEGHFVRLQVPDRILDLKGAQGIIEKLRVKSGARWFHVEPVRSRTPEPRTSIHTGMSTRDMLGAYLAARPFDGDIPSETVLAAGLRLVDTEEPA